MHVLKLSMFFQNLDFELWLEILRTSWQQLNESLKFSFSCFTIYLGNAILFMSTNQIKPDFDSLILWNFSLSTSITPYYFINSKRKLDVQFSICGWRQLKLTGLSNSLSCLSCSYCKRKTAIIFVAELQWKNLYLGLENSVKKKSLLQTRIRHHS